MTVAADATIGSTDLPLSYVGGPQTGSVHVDQVYRNTRTVWVEPTTGVIVKGSENESVTLRDGSGQDRLTALSANLTFDQPTQARQADLVRDKLPGIHQVRTWLPLASLLVGLLLLALGVALVYRRGDGARGSAEPRSGELVGS